MMSFFPQDNENLEVAYIQMPHLASGQMVSKFELFHTNPSLLLTYLSNKKIDGSLQMFLERLD